MGRPPSKTESRITIDRQSYISRTPAPDRAPTDHSSPAPLACRPHMFASATPPSPSARAGRRLTLAPLLTHNHHADERARDGVPDPARRLPGAEGVRVVRPAHRRQTH
jgi:hypothetical protein